MNAFVTVRKVLIRNALFFKLIDHVERKQLQFETKANYIKKAKYFMKHTTRPEKRMLKVLVGFALGLFVLLPQSLYAGDNRDDLILTPEPSPAPRINGAKIYGSRPGHPFIYRIPCQGNRPIRFLAKNLPASLQLDTDTGIISGTAPLERGEYVVTFQAANSHGTDSRMFKIVVGDQLALTPPMGWNHWYTWYHHITDARMREAADVMIESGMADVGYQFVNIDDCWMKHQGDKPYRDENGVILPNDKFPDMQAMTNYIHAKGLRAGLYTSPGPWTCAGYVGAFQHEDIDARTFAQWGFDFLKYDWCSYGKVAKGGGRERAIKPYQKMGAILRGLDRDIVFNLCQYGRENVWEWGAQVGGNCWRTTGDLGLERAKDLPGFYSIGFKNARWWEYAGPGHWNDPDYILIGYVGNARNQNEPPKLTALTPNEQYSYMSMWCLMAAPLIYSGDMGHLDKFTLNVLCNPEVVDVDQDVLGRQGRIIRRTDDEFVMAKPLEDGSLAVGLFNIAEGEKNITVNWSELGLKGKRSIRDLWRQKDLGHYDRQFSAKVGRHGVVLVRLVKPGV